MSTALHSTTRIRSFVIGDVVAYDMFVTDCASCGVVFAMPANLKDRRHADGGNFYCPNGHSMSWHETDEDRQRKRAERAERDAAWANARAARLRDERDAEQRSARAYRGHVTRLRNRIANGVCPVQGCRRNFANVKAHIASQHPDWAHNHAEVLT